MVNRKPSIRIKKSPRIFSSPAGWRDIGGKSYYFRSYWEVNFAKYLEWQKDQKLINDWQYEPKTFWFEGIKRGVCSYKPDFCVIRNDLTHYWVEVKGYMDSRSKTKIKRFGKYFPNEELVVLEKKWFSLHQKNFPSLCVNWEVEICKGKENELVIDSKHVN